MRTLVLIFVFLILVQTAAGDVYTVYVDREFGFWAVRSDNATSVNFTNKTLDIKTGDTVRWINMDGGDDRVTIVSDNNLWEGGYVLSDTGKKFAFTFNSSGIYRFHIIENTRINLNASNYTLNQSNFTTITYTDEDGDTHTITVRKDTRNNNRDYLKAVTETERYIYQQMILKVSGLTVGNGTFPVRTNTTRGDAYNYSSGYNYSARTGISVDARPTVFQPIVPNITATVSKPLESYQEFTIYEVLKRWYTILKGGIGT